MRRCPIGSPQGLLQSVRGCRTQFFPTAGTRLRCDIRHVHALRFAKRSTPLSSTQPQEENKASHDNPRQVLSRIRGISPIRDASRICIVDMFSWLGCVDFVVLFEVRRPLIALRAWSVHDVPIWLITWNHGDAATKRTSRSRRAMGLPHTLSFSVAKLACLAVVAIVY